METVTKENECSIILLCDNDKASEVAAWCRKHFGNNDSRWKVITLISQFSKEPDLAELRIYKPSDRLLFDMSWQDKIISIGGWRPQ